jgi:hypothetical protein
MILFLVLKVLDWETFKSMTLLDLNSSRSSDPDTMGGIGAATTAFGFSWAKSMPDESLVKTLWPGLASTDTKSA